VYYSTRIGDCQTIFYSALAIDLLIGNILQQISRLY
jgi:hypothetical protein